MDRIDRAIIAQLRRDARLTNTELADRVGLTPSPCLRRVRRLEETGVIAGYHARVDPAAMGRSFEVVVFIDLAVQDQRSVERFEEWVGTVDEIVQVRRMFGSPDYVLDVAVPDLAAYERLLTARLLAAPGVGRLNSHFTMKTLKSD
ncbi:Lrp/AsnC family transcriptional regulator [Phytohabitans kaempferiae]|uniref:Lrp/AsnC family transcriptional regulator n=1 Tax=Phytohabitans kaempferiae TaxID=1620943 RepID=A0ABV6MHS8_9ACTN